LCENQAPCPRLAHVEAVRPPAPKLVVLKEHWPFYKD
jgi:hypothetical protein